MLSSDENIINAVLASLSEKDLERMLERKRKAKQQAAPEELSEEEKYRAAVRKHIKSQLYPP